MNASEVAKRVVQQLFRMRIPGNRLYRFLGLEYQARRLLLDEAQRVFYFQPMFEARCASVGERFRLELCPDSKFPCLVNVDLKIGKRVKMSARTSFSGARRAASKPVIEIGDDSYIGHRCTLRAGTEIRIGKNVLIATNALLSGDPGHPLNAEERRSQAAPPDSLGSIHIGDDAWLAYNVSVVGNVKIGRGAVIGAGSVVTKDIPDFALAAGNPARVLRTLSPVDTATERLSRLATALVSGTSSQQKLPVNPHRLLTSSQEAEELTPRLREIYRELFVGPGEVLDTETAARVDAAIRVGIEEYRRLARAEAERNEGKPSFEAHEERT